MVPILPKYEVTQAKYGPIYIRLYFKTSFAALRSPFSNPFTFMSALSRSFNHQLPNPTPLPVLSINLLNSKLHTYISLSTIVLSLSTIVLNIGIGKKSYGFMKFRTLENKLYNRFYPKKHLECISTTVMMLYLG